MTSAGVAKIECPTCGHDTLAEHRHAVGWVVHRHRVLDDDQPIWCPGGVTTRPRFTDRQR